MIIVCNQHEYKYLAHNCDGRCGAGEWCIFADGRDNRLCPVENEDNIIIVKGRDEAGLNVEQAV